MSDISDKGGKGLSELFGIGVIHAFITLVILFSIFYLTNVLFVILTIFVSLISFMVVRKMKLQHMWLHYGIAFAFLFLPLFMYSINNIRDKNFQVVQSFGVAEDAGDAKWYILHSTPSNDTINGMSKNSVELFRLPFNQNAPKDSYWSKMDNTLYGYNAWNIGNERVLCNIAADQDSKKCIRIPQENIQLAPDITNNFPFDPSQVSVVPNSSRPETITKIPGVEEIVPANIER